GPARAAATRGRRSRPPLWSVGPVPSNRAAGPGNRAGPRFGLMSTNGMKPERDPSISSPGRIAALAALAAAAILAAACGTATPASTAPSDGTVVQVTPLNTGKTVSLHVGDTLRILLGPPIGPSALQWQVRRYPRDVLELLTAQPR